ncbi:MAG: thioredoxin fold domain-containing protein [Flavobacteriaceae bacterium]|nr:thioredoxin fold domain-containing protein [Flavobacteriaceae bacterium]
MKIIALVFAILFTGVLSAQEIKWMTMNEALEAQKEEPKHIFMDVYTTWCGPCKLLDRRTFADKNVIAFVNENYYPVKFNAEGTEEITYQDFTYTNPNYQPERKGRNATHFFADALKLQGYPSLVFFEKDGTLIQAVPGFKTPQQLEIYLKMIANGDYKALTTVEAWENYRDNFNHTFE